MLQAGLSQASRSIAVRSSVRKEPRPDVVYSESNDHWHSASLRKGDTSEGSFPRRRLAVNVVGCADCTLGMRNLINTTAIRQAYIVLFAGLSTLNEIPHPCRIGQPGFPHRYMRNSWFKGAEADLDPPEKLVFDNASDDTQVRTKN